MSVELSAKIFIALQLIIIAFQLALACGAPWGSLSMGGKFPGKYPPNMRIAAIVNALILAFIAAIVASKAQLFLLNWSAFAERAIWVVVALAALGLTLNLITPSKWERIIWAPVALILLLASLNIALH